MNITYTRSFITISLDKEDAMRILKTLQIYVPKYQEMMINDIRDSIMNFLEK